MNTSHKLSPRALIGLTPLSAPDSLFIQLAMTDTQAATELLEALPQAHLKGMGVMRFFGLRVYEARLWAAPDFDAQSYERHAFGLELVYDRRLEGQAISERSVAEMRRVGSFDEEKAQRWMGMMTRAFPNVVAGDRLSGLHDGQGAVRFFYNGRPTEEILDREYVRLFFGIWLSPQTSSPALRSALLGLQC